MGKSVKERLVEYLRDGKLDMEAITRDLGISLDILLESEDNLSAEQFLNICSYLHVRPEEFMGDQEESG